MDWSSSFWVNLSSLVWNQLHVRAISEFKEPIADSSGVMPGAEDSMGKNQTQRWTAELQINQEG